MSTFQTGDIVCTYYPGDSAVRTGEIMGGGYSPDSYRVRFEGGAIETLHRNYVYAPGEPITRRPEALEKGITTGRPRKPVQPKAPKPPKVSAKRRQQIRAILKLALDRKLAKSVAPKRWEGE